MTTTFNKKHVLLLLSTALASGVAMPALAQDSPGQVPAQPVRRSIDANGVDVLLGTINYDQPTVSIGAAYPEGLSYTSTQMGRGWVANLRSAITVSGSTYTVTIDGVSDNFAKSGATYTSIEANGAILTEDVSAGTLTYLSRQGVSAVFAVNSGGSPWYRVGYARASSITYPSGVRVDFTYKVQTFCPNQEGSTCIGGLKNALRLQSVTNTNGYQLKLTYASSDLNPVSGATYLEWARITNVSGINNGVEYCDPAADSCALTGAWPSLTITPTSVTDALNRTTQYTTVYDANSNLSSFKIKRPGAASDNFVVGYDTSGRVSSVANEGVSYTYGYSDSGATRTTTVTDPNSKTKVYTGNTSTYLLSSVQDELGRTTSYSYDANGRVTEAVAPEGNKVQYTYDARGNATKTTAVAKAGSGLANIDTFASFDATCDNPKTCNSPSSTTDARGNVTNLTYDATHGGVLTITAPAPAAGATRPQVRYGYGAYQGYYRNSGGSIVASGQTTWRLTSVSACRTIASCAGGADEVKTTIGYGSQTAGTANNLLPVSQTGGAGDGTLSATVALSYDSIGNQTYTDGPLPGTADVTRTLYDAGRQIVGVIGPDPDGAGSLKNRAIRSSYNLDGQITQIERGTTAGQTDANWSAFASLQQVVTTYDANARVQKQEIKAGGTTYGVTQASYDALGRVDCTALRINSAVWASLPASACTLQTAGSFGQDRITKSSYTAASELVTTTSGFGTVDAADDATATYTANGQVQTVTDANSNRTTYEYDGFDRLLKTRYPVATAGAGASSTTDYEQLGYDAGNNVTSRRLRDGQTLYYTYDALNRRTYDDNPGTNVAEVDVSYTYDNLGRLLRAQDGNGWFSAWEYDALGRATRQYSNVSSNALQYDLAGRRTRQTWADGFYVTNEYLVTGEMNVIRENGGLALATFGYDDLGQRTGLTRANGTVTYYGYDAISRLNGLTHDLAGTGAADLTLAFGYNPAGQITSRTSSNDAYAWTGTTNINSAYTTNGLNQYTASGSVTPTYDARGNLTGSGGQSYVYNTRNQLFQTGVTGQLFYRGPNGLLGQILSGGTGLALDYVGPDLATEMSGSVLRRYVYGPGTDEPLVWYEGSGTSDRRYLHADERGSVIAVSDSSGAAIALNRYDEYGIPSSSNIGRFQYTGQKWIAELSMYDYKARMYSPSLGRFMQTDPIGYAGGMNLYGYVGGDPVNASDSSGTCIGTRLPSGAGCTFGVSYGRQDGSGNDGAGGVGGGGAPRSSAGAAVGAVIGHRYITSYPGTDKPDKIKDIYFQGFGPGNLDVSQLTPQSGEGEDIVVQARYLRSAVIRAVSQACGGCRFDANNFVALSPNFVGVRDPSKLPRIFSRSLSSHARASAARIPGSRYEVKLYLGDTANRGSSTITITTPLTDPQHYIDFPFYLMGDPVNSYYARQYCLNAGGC